MSRRVVRQGQAVAAGKSMLVRFSGCCGSGAPCVGCGPALGCGPAREIAAERLGLPGRLQEGDAVELGLSGRALTRVAVVCFAVPLAALLAGALLGDAIAASTGSGGDAAGALLGFAGLAVALLMAARRGPELARSLEVQARVASTAGDGIVRAEKR